MWKNISTKTKIWKVHFPYCNCTFTLNLHELNLLWFNVPVAVKSFECLKTINFGA
jgi:hypothetical protein